MSTIFVISLPWIYEDNIFRLASDSSNITKGYIFNVVACCQSVNVQAETEL